MSLSINTQISCVNNTFTLIVLSQVTNIKIAINSKKWHLSLRDNTVNGMLLTGLVVVMDRDLITKLA